MVTGDKIRELFTLGEVSHGEHWQDYLQYGFNEADIPALLKIMADDAFNTADSKSKEVWAPLHAWRTLGQLGLQRAVEPLLGLFDQFAKDDWALGDLPKVMGMIGGSAIDDLVVYFNESHHGELARVMAAEGLAEMVKHQPAYRERVIQHYCDYMLSPDESAYTFNGLLVCLLLDLEARESIDDIRQFFNKDCVDIGCAGDLEEVEIELGFRDERSTAKPAFNPLELTAPLNTGSNDLYEAIDDALMLYGNDESILCVSELDGFFAALACAPDMVKPSQWLPAIWGGERLMPEWESEKEFETFSANVFMVYNHVMQSFNNDEFEALYFEREADDKSYLIVDEWCDGFLRGINLWKPMTAMDAAFTEECVQSVRLFAAEEGFEKLDSMSDEAIDAEQQKIQTDVQRLFQYFYEQRVQPAQPVMREIPKIGRNDPCPCGSGKKYKKCCLH